MTITVRITLMLSALVLAQQPVRDGVALGPGTAVLSGTVVTADKDAQPVRRARISINELRNETLVATSDDAGRFVLRGVPAGRFTLQANKAPYLAMNYGATRPDRPGTPVLVADGQTIEGLTIRMVRGAVLEGRVLDQNGEPMAFASVSALRNSYTPVTGGRAFGPVANVTTDDRGVYRAFGLAPGEYIIVARALGLITASPGRGVPVPDTRKLTAADVDRILQSRSSSPLQATEQSIAMPGTPVNWAPVHYPGTPDMAAAVRITLEAGEEQTGLDIPMRLVPTSRISGVVTIPEGIAPSAVQVMILPADPQARAIGNLGFVSNTRPAADGRYLFTGVTPGSFVLMARTGPVASGRSSTVQPTTVPMTWASSDLTVEGKDLEIPLTLQPGIPVSGRVEFRTATLPKPADVAAMRMMLRAVDSGPEITYQPAAQVTESGAFVFAGAAPGAYRFMWSKTGGSDLYPTSLTIRGRETLDSTVDIRGPVNDMTVVFTDHPSEITGTLTDATGRAATDYFILVFPTNRTFWTPLSRRVMQTRPGSDGKYILRNLPAGEYFLAALTDLAPGDSSDPAFLEQLSTTAVKINVTDGATTVQAFRIGG